MADRPVAPGTLLAGRFMLEDLLDETEGAWFWRATDKVLARNVAVHVVPAGDERAEAMLSAARTSATVTDVHLLRVLDAATEDDVAYVVNEWGSGMSLDKILAEGPLSARRAAWVVKEVAEAVAVAHRQGIAHGRLLPENVVITEAGSVKLVGFMVDAVLRGREHRTVVDGPLLGEHEADVVNLAALLYAGLVARWPGTAGSSLPAAPLEHGRALRPRRVRAGVPRPLDAICDRVLNPPGDHAPGLVTAHEVYAALCDYIGDPAGAAPAGFEPTVLVEETQAFSPPVAKAAGGRPDRADTSPPGDEGEETAAWAPGPLTGELAATRAVPAPPPLPQPDPRPLFASEQPRPSPDPVTGPPRPSPGGRHAAPRGATGLPPTWGPDAGLAPGDPEPGRDLAGQEPPGRSWLRLGLGLAAVLVLVVAVVVAFNLGRGSIVPGTGPEPGQSPDGQPSPQPRAVPITAVDDFDPQADPPEENGDLAALAADGDPQTTWRTSTYFDPIELLKDGVGLVVDLGRPTVVRDVSVTLRGAPTGVELLAAAPDAPAPTGLEELRRVAAAPRAGEQAELVPAEPVRTRYLVVWLTALPPVEGGFRGEVAEITVRT